MIDWNAALTGREWVLLVCLLVVAVLFFVNGRMRYRFGVIDGRFNWSVPPVAAIIEQERHEHRRTCISQHLHDRR